METVTLIQCTASKRDGTHPARLLYDESAYFRAMRDWAEARGNPWYVLSAKHGLVPPDRPIKDYDERGLTDTQCDEIAEQLDRMGVRVAHVTAGRDYTAELVPALERRGVDVVNHFAGERIGERIRSLNAATTGMVNEAL